MSDEQMRAIEGEFMLVVRRAMIHQAWAHAPAVLVSEDICPEGAMLVCGSAVWERLFALHVEGLIELQGVADASALIEKLKKG